LWEQPTDVLLDDVRRGRDVDGGGEGVGDGGRNLGGGEAAPEDVPVGEAGQTVGLLRVPGVDGVGGARAPEEARILAGHALPEVAADAFALGLALDGELGQV